MFARVNVCILQKDATSHAVLLGTRSQTSSQNLFLLWYDFKQSRFNQLIVNNAKHQIKKERMISMKWSWPLCIISLPPVMSVCIVRTMHVIHVARLEFRNIIRGAVQVSAWIVLLTILLTHVPYKNQGTCMDSTLYASLWIISCECWRCFTSLPFIHFYTAHT